MANIMRIRVQLTGSAVVGPSVSTFFWDASVTGGPAALRTFYNANVSRLPTTVTYTVDSAGDILDSANGDLVGTWSEAAGAAVTGTDGSGPIDGVGARIRWLTAGTFHGRRVVGSTFMVPLGRGAMSSNGQPDGTTQSGFQTAAAALVTTAAGAMKIWSRPSPGGSDGIISAVTAAQASPEVSWLRSRRT